MKRQVGLRTRWMLVMGLFLAACRAPAGLDRPNGVAVAPTGEIYVMDFGRHRIARLTAEGKLAGAFGRFGDGTEQIYYGWDLAMDAAGNLYFGNLILDDEGVRHDGVKMFAPDGGFLREIGGQDYARYSDAPPRKPYGLDVDNQGRVYVAEYGMNDVRVFDAEGRLLAEFFADGEPGIQFSGLQDVAVDDERRLLYVADFDLSRLEQFRLEASRTGAPTVVHVRTVAATYGNAPGELAFPQYLAVNDETGWLYVGDLANRRIQVFDAEGRYVTHFSAPEVSDWQVMGLAIGPEGDVYAADSLNNVIWVFGPRGEFRRRLGGR